MAQAKVGGKPKPKKTAAKAAALETAGAAAARAVTTVAAAPKKKPVKAVAAKLAPAPRARPAPKAKPAPEIKPAPEASVAPESAEPKAGARLSPAQREVLEQMSANLARAALTAQGAIAEAALRQADRPAALSADPFHVGPALSDVMGRLVAQPDKLMRSQADLFSRYMDLW
ncbi:MAG TPA: class I poly(R)-hydroxyalkanoic acid synthase, partial [Caulobacteraceae bacterium]|nr:class I poly(R)-hydroxyalkanoic acid synthase [Caulobacteraceae bacterium]